MLGLNLIIDSNFILNKVVFNLFKEKRLYIDLERELGNSFNSLYKIASFNNIYIVSDSNKTSWRKNIYSDYKVKRKKDDSIDWQFVFDIYQKFITNQINIRKSFKIYRIDGIEADDIIAKIVQKTNINGESNFIISNDHDIKQFLYYDISNNTINFMSNEYKSRNEMIYLPYDYKAFLSYNFNNEKNNIIDIFDLDSFETENKAHYIIDKMLQYRTLDMVYSEQSLFKKIVSGDISDNIKSVYINKNRGIGKAGAEKIYQEYVKAYGLPVFKADISDNKELFENMVDIITEIKKIGAIEFDNIMKNIEFNFGLISLKKLPKDIDDKINEVLK